MRGWAQARDKGPVQVEATHVACGRLLSMVVCVCRQLSGGVAHSSILEGRLRG